MYVYVYVNANNRIACINERRRRKRNNPDKRPDKPALPPPPFPSSIRVSRKNNALRIKQATLKGILYSRSKVSMNFSRNRGRGIRNVILTPFLHTSLVSFSTPHPSLTSPLFPRLYNTRRKNNPLLSSLHVKEGWLLGLVS